jgi:hypothetical protein
MKLYWLPAMQVMYKVVLVSLSVSKQIHCRKPRSINFEFTQAILYGLAVDFQSIC